MVEYRLLGRTGVNVAPLALGTDNFADPTPEGECVEILERAMDAGINLIATGDVYADGEGEKVIGRILKANGRRHEVLIGTKVDHGRRRVGVTLEDHTDEIGPNECGHSSPEIPFDEILRALDDLVRAGKVRYIGCSTHPAWMVAEAVMTSELKGYVRFVAEESPYNLLDRRIENELIPMCQHLGVGLVTWAPMAMGVLAGRYANESDYPKGSRAALRGGFYADRVTARGVEVGRSFAKLAEDAGINGAQLSVLWCKDQPGVTAPLIGPRTMKHLEDILPVLEMTLSDDLRAACDELVPPGCAVADFHNTADWMKGTVL